MDREDAAREIEQRGIRGTLERRGITDEYLTEKLKEELDANEVKTASYLGEISYSKPMIAWDVRQRARQDAHKLRGDYPTEKVDVTVRPLVVLDLDEDGAENE